MMWSIIFLLSVGGCATRERVPLEKIPKPQVIAENGKPKMRSGGIIHQHLKKTSPQLKDIIVNDRAYVYITNQWFEELKGWTDRYIARIAPNVGTDGPNLIGYTRTYSMLMNSAANLQLAKRYNIKASVLIGLMVARNEKPWGKLPGDSNLHDYLIGLTEDGGIVWDMGTGQSCRLADFPNKESMVGMLF